MFYANYECAMKSIINYSPKFMETKTTRVICTSGVNVLISFCRYALYRVAYLHLMWLQPREVFLFPKEYHHVDMFSIT